MHKFTCLPHYFINCPYQSNAAVYIRTTDMLLHMLRLYCPIRRLLFFQAVTVQLFCAPEDWLRSHTSSSVVSVTSSCKVWRCAMMGWRATCMHLRTLRTEYGPRWVSGGIFRELGTQWQFSASRWSLFNLREHRRWALSGPGEPRVGLESRPRPRACYFTERILATTETGHMTPQFSIPLFLYPGPHAWWLQIQEMLNVCDSQQKLTETNCEQNAFLLLN